MSGRLDLIKNANGMNDCKICGLSYMPFNKKYDDECPKCGSQVIDYDEQYLDGQKLIFEEVSTDNLNDDFPKGDWS